MKEKGGKKANRFDPELKPSSPTQRHLRAPVYDRETHDLVPGMPRGQGVSRLLVPLTRLVHKVTPGLTVPVWLKKSSIKVVPAPRRSRICWLPEDTRDSVQAGKRRRAGIPPGRLQRVLRNAVRGLGRRQAGDRIQTQVRQDARGSGRRWEEDHVLRGCEEYGPRLSHIQADVCSGA